jgi:3'-5' exoribonuclease
MKNPCVSQLEPNQLVQGVFLVQQKEVRQKKTGEPYLSLVLSDRTGDLEAKMWDNAQEAMGMFERDGFVRVKGMLQTFQNRPQLTIHRIQPVPESEIDIADYLPASKRDRNEMFAEMRSWIASMTDPHLKALLETIFADEAVALAYRTAPAAKSVHHAWIGGLIEHVLSLCNLAKFTAAHYPDVDFDLLLTGVLLHDIGKIAELNYARSFGYSTEGQLIGHITLGIRMVEDAIRKVPGFPPALQDLVVHMILSHHGALEFGSPKLPMFLEAMLLHQLDNLDSKMECMRAHAEKDRQTADRIQCPARAQCAEKGASPGGEAGHSRGAHSSARRNGTCAARREFVAAVGVQAARRTATRFVIRPLQNRLLACAAQLQRCG